eukprot:11347941-Alexandrium_andersonii.AAC.1
MNCPCSLVVEEREGSGVVSKLCPSDFLPGCFGLSQRAGPRAPLLQHVEFGQAMWHSAAAPIPG